MTARTKGVSAVIEGAAGVKSQGLDLDRKADAQRWLAEMEVTKTRGQWIDPAMSRITVEAWASTFAEGLVHLKPSTRERYRLALRRHIVPSFGRFPLGAVAA